jgi:hypothetical protein
MATKTDFSATEWETLRDAPHAVVLAIAAAGARSLSENSLCKMILRDHTSLAITKIPVITVIESLISHFSRLCSLFYLYCCICCPLSKFRTE